MEHEVFVPVPVAALRRTLGDPARVARCVPNLQQDAEAPALTGRLKVRIGGHTITYRGALTVRPADGGDTFSVAGEGVEARGTGSAKLALIIGLAPADGGTTIGFAGTVSGDGRIVDVPEEAAAAAAHRLLDRFTRQLVTESLASRDTEGATGTTGAEGAEGAVGATGAAGAAAALPADRAPLDEESPGEGPADEALPDAELPDEELPDEELPDEELPGLELPDEELLGLEMADDEELPDDEAGGGDSVFDAPVPPSSLDPAAGLEFTVPDGPPAEAAHARRTMIGRSTEEVDHAPPRGRYAPVPSPGSGGAGAVVRRYAPVAALAIASAVVVGRALRRRR
ncbi:SRPBCC domain-containing protein [Streptomyces nitrosporeus]|uniref:SRPBCC domain-containing protein n=1 Tax=Streptomyces nitrosporeus TaxID=28894 RepID=UPI00332F2A82